MPSDLRAISILRANIQTLLIARRESQADLSRWLKHSRAWLNKFLNGDRQIQLKDLDKIASFFGIAPYQLFQPGISQLTERRVQDRRKRPDRRVGHAVRLHGMLALPTGVLLRGREKPRKRTGTEEDET